MAGDYGLVGGIGQGLQAGIQTYMQQRNYQNQLYNQNLNRAITMKSQHMQLGPVDANGTPSVGYDETGQQQQNVAKGLLTQQEGEQTAGTPQSLAKIHGYQQALNSFKPGMGKIFDESMSGVQADEAYKPYKDVMAAQAQQMKMQGFTQSRMDANQMHANSAYDNVIGKNYENRLDAAQRVNDLITAARNKTLIPSENLGQQLATDINMLQSGHTSVSGTEHARPTTLFGKAGQLQHFVTGDPKAAITDSDLGQMQKETGVLYNDIGDQHKAKFSSWIKGQPEDLSGPLTDRFNESRNQYFGSDSRLAKQTNKGLVQEPQGLVGGQEPSVDEMRKALKNAR